MHNNLNDIIDKISGKTLEEKLFTLSKCNCCPRHSINKPFMFTPWKEEETKRNDYTNIYINRCKCDCRHNARNICREHPDYLKI
jgi:hypothetical protein